MNDKDFEKIYNESDKLEQASKIKNETTPFEDTPQAWYELDQLVRKTKMLYVEILYGIEKKVIKT